MRESILTFARWRYLIVSVVLALAASAAYLIQDPQEPPNGGTWLGYSLGVAGALLVVWLMYFGVRKRRYTSTLGTVKGWLSAHVYLGVLLALIVTLHSGFQLGANVHGLAYVLMIGVIGSGMLGVFAYHRYPAAMSENRRGVGRQQMLGQLADIDRRAKKIAEDLPEDFGELIGSAINRTVLGGSAWAQLTGRDLSRVVLPRNDGHDVVANAGQEAALDWLAEQQSRGTDAQQAAATAELAVLLRNRRGLLQRLRKDIRIRALLDAWLFVHVPLSFALLAAISVHVITVFVYW